jgi:hypothetical protein
VRDKNFGFINRLLLGSRFPVEDWWPARKSDIGAKQIGYFFDKQFEALARAVKLVNYFYRLKPVQGARHTTEIIVELGNGSYQGKKT